MNYLVVGLSGFGCAVAQRLTSMGHDVMGIDADMHLVELYKDTISSTMQLSLTDAVAVKALPLKDINEVIVAIQGSIGDSILAVSLLKQAGIKNLTATADNSIHQTILESLGIYNIIIPEMYAAELFTQASDSQMIKGIYTVSDNYQIVEVVLPAIYAGLSLEQAGFETLYNLTIVAIKRQFTHTNILGNKTVYYEVVIPEQDFKFQEEDRVLLFGSLGNISRFKRHK